jgi:pSer/pThr/pTyr-binding forkhead associated (FHA) protein
LIIVIGILLLAAAGTSFLLYRGWRPPWRPMPALGRPQGVAPTKSPVPPAPSAIQEPEAAPRTPSPVTTERPQPGIPYLESLGRPAGTVYCALDRPAITVGRADDGSVELVIDAYFEGWQTVSRRHARLEREGRGGPRGCPFVVVDLDSENGVYVNGRRTKENVLYDGYVVSFGQVQFAFRMNREGGVT